MVKRPEHVLVSAKGWERRNFLKALLATGGAVLFPACGKAANGSGGVVRAGESSFPGQVPLYLETYENWSREFHIPDIRTCAPESPEDLVSVANWAAKNDVVLRPRGMRHGWSPLTVNMNADSTSPVVLADTTQHLNRIQMETYAGLPAVRCEAGVMLEDLMAFIGAEGYGFTAIPQVGEVTIGGVLAINGHGTAIPTPGEQLLPQQTYGSLSNRVLEITVIAWSPSEQRYQLKRFDRTDPEISALMTSLGRAFITEVVLAVEPDHKLRCVSYVDIAASELFAAPGSGGRTIESFLDTSGRFESLWYPYTDYCWMKAWYVAPTKPLLSREVTGPYNYVFTDNVPEELQLLAEEMMAGNPQAAPQFGAASYAGTVAGLTATNTYDIWGSAKDTLLYVRPNTFRATQLSYVVLTRRESVQQVLHEHAREFNRQLSAYQEAGKYPVNFPVEYRATGLDHPEDIGLPGAQPVTLSGCRPNQDHPEWDTAVWISTITLTETPDQYSFFRDMEVWMHNNYSGGYASLRPEWSKGWAYSEESSWTDQQMLEQTIPDLFRQGEGKSGWDDAIKTFNRLDPKGVFFNGFTKGFL